MAEEILSLSYPFGGLSETYSTGSQEQGTARELVNMRGLNPRNGRLTGSQRSGLSKYLTSPLKLTGTKCQDLLSFFQDNRRVTYSAFAVGSETTTWDTATPSKKDCFNVKTDRQGNVYALDGNVGVVKYGTDGTQLWQLTLPVGDTNHVIRALFVDDVDRVYVGVSSGGLQEKAKMWAYDQLPDDKTEQLWEIETKAYVEDFVVSQGKLYTIQNHVDRQRSYARVYDFIDETDPEKVQEWQIPHPANSITVKSDGAVVVACQPQGDTTSLYWRNPDPTFPNFNVGSIDWTPKQLTDAEKRIWGWWVADDIDQSDVADDLAEGVEILRWRDRSKNLRHVFADLTGGTTGDAGPQLARDALNGHAGVRFNKTGTTQPLQVLRSNPNASTAKEFADQQRTMVPTYTDSSFAMYIVCRPSQTQPDTDSQPRWLFGQDRDNAQSGANDHVLFVNTADTNGNTLPPNGDAGSVYWYTGQTALSGGSGTGGVIRNGDFDVKPGTATTNPGNFAIITLVNDGQVSGDTQESLFQINGNPIDLFQSRTSVSLQPSYLGAVRVFGALQPTSGVSGYLGDILEILVLDRRSRSDAAQNVLTYDSLQFDSVAQSQNINENTLVVGYLAHKYGAQANLPFGTAATNNYPHPFGITGTSPDQIAGPPDQTGSVVSRAQALANKRFGCVVKYNAEGKIQWTANEMELDSGSRTGGYGYAVKVNSDGNIYSMGPSPTGAAGGTQQVRLIIDQGTDFSIATADGAWSASFTGGAEQDYAFPRIDVDEFDNLYIPFYETSLGAGSNATFQVYSKTGTLLHAKLFGSPQHGAAVAVDRRIPEYRDDLTTKTVEHVIVVGPAAEAEASTVLKVRLVQATQSGDSPRDLVTMGVSGGDIVKFTTSGVTTPTGGSGALDADAYVQSTTLFKKAYWTDGRQYRQYDPVTNLITEYKSTSAGGIPSRCALIESWRGRIVLARSADEPHNWFLSKKDDATNFDFFPPVPGETDAVAGNNSPAGLCPDIINSVVPYSEDILVFGCDHSIWMLDGDPAAGGRLELISDITGMAFGRPWAKDPNGVLYFFGSRGGIFRWTPGGLPERVSLMKIERQLQDVDLGDNYIRLIYNYADEGLHILQMPFGDGGSQLTHWFHELKTQSFSQDFFGSSSVTNVQPTAAMVIDGDAFDDRAVLFGCEDGFVRRWDRDALSDDTEEDGTTPVPIDAKVLFGPLQRDAEESSGMETQFTGLMVVLGENDDGARYELFASETPDSVGDVLRTGELKPGRNAPRWDRVTGPYCWLRLRNTAAEETWSFERALIRASVAGLARPRSR